ncbi:hypothetical protein AY601_4058 [Pedobacter cryoconitis]|uniref:Uncharacterized protein n=2 Tax=Pedobacter cryoconitis TaxID=188932 RepID=A0A127VJ24_9SPHI|nr:hypothetical protein AY601_4058 [Pedobacter cryoconitis]
MMFAALKNNITAPTGRIIKVSVEDDSHSTIAAWNKWVPLATHGVFKDTTGAATTIKLIEVNSVSAIVSYGYISHPVNDPDFPDAVLDANLYIELSTTKNMQFQGLNPSKQYTFIFATYPNTYDISYGQQSHILGGVQKIVANDTDAIYKCYFESVSPDASGNITYSIAGLGNSNYAFLSAFIIKEL